MVNPKRNYGDMPLIVLTAGRHPVPPSMPADVREQGILYFRAVASVHDACVALSTRGRNQLVPDSGHLIQVENPAAVVEAINHVLAGIGPQSPNQSAATDRALVIHRIKLQAFSKESGLLRVGIAPVKLRTISGNRATRVLPN